MPVASSWTVTPMAATNFHGISWSRDLGAEPPRMRVATTCPDSRAATRGAGVPSAMSWSSSTPSSSEVVHDADRVTVVVDQLAVQQVQPSVECRHWPAPVTIINGIAATEAARMITRYTEPNTFVSLPFVLSPMYSESLATMRIGR